MQRDHRVVDRAVLRRLHAGDVDARVARHRAAHGVGGAAEARVDDAAREPRAVVERQRRRVDAVDPAARAARVAQQLLGAAEQRRQRAARVKVGVHVQLRLGEAARLERRRARRRRRRVLRHEARAVLLRVRELRPPEEEVREQDERRDEDRRGEPGLRGERAARAEALRHAGRRFGDSEGAPQMLDRSVRRSVAHALRALGAARAASSAVHGTHTRTDRSTAPAF